MTIENQSINMEERMKTPGRTALEFAVMLTISFFIWSLAFHIVLP
jgi:hypothetical protein